MKFNSKFEFKSRISALLGLDGSDRNKCPFRFPSSYDVKNVISRTFDAHQNQLCNLLSALHSVCLTLDIWANKHRSFFGVTAHGLDENTFERISVALSCTKFPHPHTGDNIAEQTQLMYATYQLSTQKVVAGIMDNAANFSKAFRDHGLNHDEYSAFVECEDEAQDDSLNFEKDNNDTTSAEETTYFFPEVLSSTILPDRVTCACHNFNLIGTKDISEAQNDRVYSKLYISSFEKLNKLWNKTQRSKSSETIRQILHCGLNRPVITRWNSVCNCVSEIIEKESKLVDDVMTEFGIPTFTPTEKVFLKEWVQVLTPVTSALLNLEKTNCHYGILLPTLFTVRKRMNVFLSTNEIKYCKPLAQAILMGMRKRFIVMDFKTKEAVPALIATCTHPHFKLRWLGELKSSDNIEFIRQCLLRAAEDFVSNETINLNSKSCSLDEGNSCFPKLNILNFELILKCYFVSVSAHQGKSFSYDFDDSMQTTSLSIQTEILNFLQQPCTADLNDFGQLHQFPVIKKMFLKYNTILPSSAPVERLFSFAGIL